MRYMLIMQAPESMAVGEADGPPPAEVFEAMGRYNHDLVEAGVLLAAEGLASSAEGFVVTHDGETASVTDGPFTEAKELVGGFWILKVDSLEQAVSWARRAPFRHGERLEVRRVSEAEDFEGIAPQEVLDAEEELRARTAQQHGS